MSQRFSNSAYTRKISEKRHPTTPQPKARCAAADVGQQRHTPHHRGARLWWKVGFMRMGFASRRSRRRSIPSMGGGLCALNDNHAVSYTVFRAGVFSAGACVIRGGRTHVFAPGSVLLRHTVSLPAERTHIAPTRGPGGLSQAPRQFQCGDRDNHTVPRYAAPGTLDRRVGKPLRQRPPPRRSQPQGLG